MISIMEGYLTNTS